jgi:uncharacterized lipoprotein YddW (UPF0748 family)
MMAVPWFLVLTFSASSNDLIIDEFHYPDAQAAARAWKASGGTPPATTAVDQGRPVLQFHAPFATYPSLERTILDRKVRLDLAAHGELALDIAVEKPAAVSQVSLYFHSGDGWYASAASLRKKGWQTLRFPRAAFRTEGRPAGWQQIDSVRISLWRAQPQDTWARLGRLAALHHDVALVLPSRGPELRSARHTAATVADLLAELGLGADGIDEDSLASGALDKRRIAILADNPNLGDQAAALLEQFVARGGKVFACYHVPPRLQKLLGFGKLRYVRPEQPDRFAAIRCDSDIPGLPPVVQQRSWNITVAEPLGQGARVIGRWYDSQGRSTGHAALLLSEKGVFFSHVILSDDREGKKQLLAALLGRLEPALWKKMAQGHVDRLNTVGHLASIEELTGFIKQGESSAASQCLSEGMALAAKARSLMAQHPGPEAAKLACQARQRLVEAYLRAIPSRTSEGRAFWNHSGSGAYPGDWARTVRELRAGGFNMILPNLLWGGLAHYPSDLLPRSETFRKHGDQVAQCLAAAHANGLEVHVWKVNHNLSNAPRDLVEKLRREHRTQVSVRGEPVNWLCPSHPENFPLERDSMLEVARRYEVDGLHFDYIRYPDQDSCFCEGCRQRFETDTGRKVATWPRDCFNGSRRDEYRQWRCQQITRLVAAVSTEGRKIRPKLKISAAVFSAYPACRESVGQDWVSWVKAGYLDFLCPMDYTESDLAFAGMVTEQLRLVAGRIPVYPGIGASASRSSLGSDQVASQIRAARTAGAAGFTVFDLNSGTISQIVPGVALGATSRPAAPPHHD